MLEVRDLSVSYGKHRALENASLRVAPGEIVVIRGVHRLQEGMRVRLLDEGGA